MKLATNIALWVFLAPVLLVAVGWGLVLGVIRMGEK